MAVQRPPSCRVFGIGMHTKAAPCTRPAGSKVFLRGQRLADSAGLGERQRRAREHDAQATHHGVSRDGVSRAAEPPPPPCRCRLEG
jgi:hypothetical protein